MDASTYGKTDHLDGLLSFSISDVGNLHQGNGSDAPNDKTISHLLAKGTWKIGDNQSLIGNLRYYNNRAQQPNNPQQSFSGHDNLMTDRSTILHDMALSYRLNPVGQDWLDADAKIYYSQVEINAHTYR